MSNCVSCSKPLVLLIQDSDDEDHMQAGASTSAPETVPDDIQLSCSCHFHWQCLLDAYSITSCPNCGKEISSTNVQGQEVVLVNLNNEGGVQRNLDVLPLLMEESYLKAYPEERKSRAFLEFVREGDLGAVVVLIRASSQIEEVEDEEEDDDEIVEDEDVQDVPQQNINAVLRYQDPLDEGRSALHLAVIQNKPEIMWLLLLLASNLDPSHFPSEVQQAAINFGLSKNDQKGLQDVRGLKDAGGRTAFDLANTLGNIDLDVRLLAPT